MRRKTTLTVTIMAMVLALASTAWTCTKLVDGTNGTSSSDGPNISEGDTIDGDSVIVHSIEDESRCDADSGTSDEDRECDYSLGIVNPTHYDSPSSGGDDPSPTCHYGTPQSSFGSQFATIANHSAVDHTVNGAGTETTVSAEGTFGDLNGPNDWEDDEGVDLGTGDTYMCFYSSDSDDQTSATHLNGADDGAATATDPLSFTVV
ncbi:MAG: hypothetical protein WD250_07235 [Egibacteraceae bacterium]